MLNSAPRKISIVWAAARYLALVWASIFVPCFFASSKVLGGQERGQTPDISIVPKPINDTFDSTRIHNANKNAPPEQQTAEVQDSCLLPPLTLIHSPVVAATALAVPLKAKKEYFTACAALKEKKTDSAEKHLRKAVQVYPKYSAAWVTLGQVLATQNQGEESRSACAQASTVEPNYLPAYLCLAELAAREKAWNVVLQLSNQALALDPSSTAIAYEYNAAADLRMNKLDDAEKSALRALEIDKNHSDPRIHFVLAQIYEAKGERSQEVFHLQQYLKVAKNSDDIEQVKEYLSRLEKAGTGGPAAQPSTRTLDTAPGFAPQAVANTELAAVSTAQGNASTAEDEDNVPPKCNLEDVLPQVQRRIREFVDNVQKFTATESLVHESLNGSGQVAKAERGKYDYVVSVEESVPGMLAVNEYQNTHSSSGIVRAEVVTKGLPALLLIFHPYYAGDFSMRCEGLTILKGGPAWRIHFRQRGEKPSRIRSYKMGATGPAYEVNLQGRAWFTADDYQIVKLEADLIKTIPEIQLTVDHTSAEYGPIHFQSRGIDIWLPQAADLVSERRGKRLHERITFSDYLLFAVDNKQEIASPKNQEWLSGSQLCWVRGFCDANHLSASDTVRFAGILLPPN